MENIKNYRDHELKSYVIANILMLLIITGVFTGESGSNGTLMTDLITSIIESAIFSSILYVYVFILDSLVPSKVKDVFSLPIKGELPASTIFTKIENNMADVRFTSEVVKEKYSDVYLHMPRDKKAMKHYQNSCWYKIMQKYKDDKKILISHRDYLLCRDITSMTCIFAIFYLLLCWMGVLNISRKMLYFLLAEYIITMISTRVKAKRFTYNVIAQDLAKE